MIKHLEKKEKKTKCFKKNTKIIVIAILAILLIGAFGYIGISKYNEKEMLENQMIFQQGAQRGYQEAIIQVANLAVTCKPVPLNIQNTTINMVAIDCLKQQANQQETPVDPVVEK